MGVDGFIELLVKFTPVLGSVNPLCKEIRGILFAIFEDGQLVKGGVYVKR